MIGLVICAGLFVYFRYTQHGKVQYFKLQRWYHKNVKMRFLIWRHNTLQPWFKANKDHAFFKYFENANWFKWYGKKVVYVKPKSEEKLSHTEKDVKDAINAKDYEKALEIAKGLKGSPKVAALIQFLEGKVI